jgi:hypothetical protein
VSFAFPNAVSGQGSNVSSVTSPTFNSTSGNLLVANGFDNLQNANTPTYSDNNSLTWTQTQAVNNGSGNATRASQYHAKNITGRAGHTVTYNIGTSAFPTICVLEVSGADVTSPKDQNAGTSNNAALANPHVTGTTGTTAQADELCVSGLTHDGGNSNTFTSGNGYTQQAAQTNTSNMPGCIFTKVVSATGTQSDSFSLSPNDSVRYGAVVGTYKAAAAGAPTSFLIPKSAARRVLVRR